MKNTYIFLVIFCAFSLKISAQSDCSKAYAYMVYALSYSESALESNDIEHVKHFSERSKMAFGKAQSSLNSCPCDSVEDMVNDAITYLSKVKNARTIKESYYYSNKGQKLADATISQLDNCTESVKGFLPDVSVEIDSAIDELASIEAVQNDLLQQQEALKQKQAELKQRLVEKKEQELVMKRKELISKFEITLNTNVSTFNEALKACDCQKKTLEASFNNEELQVQSLEVIKSTMIDGIKNLTVNYLKQLENCNKGKASD